MHHFIYVFLPLLSVFHPASAQKDIANFIFFGLDRDRIHDTAFLNNEHIEGAQLKYTWKELEPEKGKYQLSLIQQDLDFLHAKGKKLFIQLQDVTFDTAYIAVPAYLTREEQYHGGVNIQYETDDKDNIIRQDGYVARRWDPNVAQRFYALLSVLGKQFDGKIEGINLPETAVGFGETGKLYPEGFTPELYKETIIAYMNRTKKAFPTSVVIQYANFMPGEWLPYDDKSYLSDVYAFAKENGIGMGGPDIKIYKKAQMNHSYKFLKEYANDITTGIAVQDGNYEEINPKTGNRVTIAEIYGFGKDYIGLDYIFWCTQEPFYSREVLPFLQSSTVAPINK